MRECVVDSVIFWMICLWFFEMWSSFSSTLHSVLLWIDFLQWTVASLFTRI
jgi:hypothetical protein